MEGDLRRLLQDGDPTANKGVLKGTSNSTNHGRRIAVEGDFATCPKCGVGGPVYNDCNPRWMDVGKSVLVEGARVYCKCVEKPLVFATQNVMTTEVITGAGRNSSRTDPRKDFSVSSAAQANPTSSKNEQFDEMVCAMGSNGPISEYPFVIETSDGRILSGKTDANGHLPRIETMPGGALTIYWGDEALAMDAGGHDA